MVVSARHPLLWNHLVSREMNLSLHNPSYYWILMPPRNPAGPHTDYATLTLLPLQLQPSDAVFSGTDSSHASHCYPACNNRGPLLPIVYYPASQETTKTIKVSSLTDNQDITPLHHDLLSPLLPAALQHSLAAYESILLAAAASSR
jgi:hypothetical protein